MDFLNYELWRYENQIKITQTRQMKIVDVTYYIMLQCSLPTAHNIIGSNT